MKYNIEASQLYSAIVTVEADNKPEALKLAHETLKRDIINNNKEYQEQMVNSPSNLQE